MKKVWISIFLVVCIVIICLVLFVYYSKNSKVGNECPEREMTDLCSATIVDGSLTNTGCKIEIDDKSNALGFVMEVYGYFSIDFLKNGKWYELPVAEGKSLPKPLGYESGTLKFTIGPNGEIIENTDYEPLPVVHNWENIYGQLKVGKYRLVKWILDVSRKRKILLCTI